MGNVFERKARQWVGDRGEEIDACHPPTQETTALAVEECELRMETFRRNLTLLRRISLPGG